ncbi:MAG: hypothetical protein LBR10_06920 [Prevotellaceae bacterium]|jgi:CRISPR-associated endonuclease Csn1|nr:hypothetical protein [Prevotellaceae bacterium]
MKNILGLDLGTNSIGWAVVEIDHERRLVKILGLGSRILTMDAGEITTFESGGKLLSTAAQRTEKRSSRRLNERFLLRRDRLHCVLNLLNALPEHYKLSIEFANEKGKRSGKFKKGVEEKLAYCKDENGKFQFLFMDAYHEMENEFKQSHPELFYAKKNGNQTKLPYDWTLYYLRKKALQDKNNKLTKEELAWITLSFNQKRGYEKVIGQDEKAQKEGELRETFTGKVKSVKKIGNKDLYEIVLVDFNNEDIELYRYNEESKIQITFENDLKEVETISKYDEDGNIDAKNAEYIINEILENLLVTSVKNTGRKKNENWVFEIELKTGWVKEQQSRYTPKWEGLGKDFIVKTKYDVNGNRILKGADKGRNINIPKEEDWTLMKLKTETSINSFNTKHGTKGVAPFIYYNLLQNPIRKIKGDLVTVIERNFYQEELDAIYEKQKQYHPELKNRELYQQAIELLYPNNENHRKTIASLDFEDLIGGDILFYQRELKSKKSLIADCEYEKENYERIDPKTGQKYKKPLKAIHKFNPLYQEFRLWQFIKRLKIIKLEEIVNGEILLNQDVTKQLLTNDIKEKLFEVLNNKGSITQKQLLEQLGKLRKQSFSPNEYKWNFPIYDDEEKKVEHKEVCNVTRYDFIVRLKKIKGFDWKTFLSPENEYLLWHFFYSVKKKEEFTTGLHSLISKLLVKSEMPDRYKTELIKSFSSFTGYSNDYGTYSEKAIKKLLLFMRLGKYWNQNDVENILKNITTEVKEKVFEKEEINGEIVDFQGLWISSACYLIYGRYSEVGDVQFWSSPYDIENYLRNEFKQHSLNNPVVEKVLVETLHIVQDIWMYYGEKEGVDENGRPVYKKLFDKIHIELGREMKKNNKQKAKADKRNNENKQTNARIIELLKELKKENPLLQVKSPFQQEKLRILEDGLLASIEYDKDIKVYQLENDSRSITKKEIKEITSKDFSKISRSDFERYKLWLDQRYQSPYTGKMIKLSELFDREKYQIEHIFPRERITLDALYNKVICETEVNEAKKALTGYEFILQSKSKPILCAAHNNQKIEILSIEGYEDLVNRNFTGKKREILLSKDIPDDFTNSQLNNSQYIAKMAMKLLSNIVREKDEDTFRSKNVLATNGAITSTLKRHWQLNETWNELIAPRFKRLNELTNSNLFGEIRLINGHEVFINQVPEEINNDFNPKRIDHRHHALDALIIALTTENHVNYLNNISSQEKGNNKLETRKAIKYQLTESRKISNDEKESYFLPPAQIKAAAGIIRYEYEYKNEKSKIFKDIAKIALENTIASFKQKNKIIRQRWNKYSVPENGEFIIKKEGKLKEKDKFGIRQSLHEDTFYGKVNLIHRTKEISLKEAILGNYDIVDRILSAQIEELRGQIASNEIITQLSANYPIVKVYEKYIASRYGNDLESLANVSSEKIIGVIENITDKSIQDILKNHLYNYDTISLSIEDSIKYVDFIVDDEHKKIIKDLIKDDRMFDYIIIEEKTVNKTDVFVKDLRQEIENKEIKHNPHLAFSYDGIKFLNETSVKSGNVLTKKGKPHKPIYKVRKAGKMGTAFSVSENKCKDFKYVKTDQGSNAFCGIYENNENGQKKRLFYIPTLRETISNLKEGISPCPENHPEYKDFKLLFVLNPNDLVYVPTRDEIENNTIIDTRYLNNEQKNRIYKFTDGTGTTLNFIPSNISSPIISIKKEDHAKLKNKDLFFEERKNTKKGEKSTSKNLLNEIGLGSDINKNQNSIDGIQIKSFCIKLNMDRLGNITKT